MKARDIQVGKYYLIAGEGVWKCTENDVGKKYSHCTNSYRKIFEEKEIVNINFDNYWAAPEQVVKESSLEEIKEWIKSHEERGLPCERLKQYVREIEN